ncbi:MAG: sulfurtransferase [Proteobacteria bacterium]|nr:sulfurtransferase [Pseudomonadota bacterium]
MQELSARELKAHLETCDEPPLLLDVRQPWEFDTCKIENSVLLPMPQVTAEYKTLDFDRETVVICHHGIRSRRVGRYLEEAGFSNIINLSGGVAQWAKTVDTNMATY